MLKLLKLFFSFLVSKFKNNNKNSPENHSLVSPRFFSLNDFDFYKLKRMDINSKVKNKNTFLFFTKFLNKLLLKKKFKNFFFFKTAKIHSFFIILLFSYIIFYNFFLDKNFEIEIPLSKYFYSQKPEDLILYLQHFEEIKKNQNFYFFSSKKIVNNPFFSKFFFFDNIFFSPENIQIKYEHTNVHYFKQFFENSLEKPLSKYDFIKENDKDKIVDFSEENTDIDIIIENSIASSKQKEYVKNLISKKNFFLFNTPKYKENFIKISKFQNFIADLGLLDVKISDFNQTFIEKQFPFKATHYKKSHIQALAELGVNSKNDLFFSKNDQNFFYQKSDYVLWSELNINLASNKFFLIQDQLNFFLLKNLNFKLFLLSKNNINLNLNSLDFILNKYDIDLSKKKNMSLNEKIFIKEKNLLNLVTNSYSSKNNKFFKFYENPIEYDKNTHKEIIKFDLIKINRTLTNKIFNTTNKYINVNQDNFEDIYLFWFNYFDFTFLKYFKRRDFLYLIKSHESGHFNFPELKEELDENFFLTRKKKFKKLLKLDPFRAHVYAITQEEYDDFLSVNLDFKLIIDNPKHNKYQEGTFDFVEYFTDKFLISNSFISLNKDFNLDNRFLNLNKYNEIYNKILYFFDAKLNRIEIQIKFNREKIMNHILKNVKLNYNDDNKLNFLNKKDLIDLKNRSKYLLNLFDSKKSLNKNLINFKNSKSSSSSIETNLINFYMNNYIQNYKFIDNSFIYNIEKKNLTLDLLKKKLYFFNLYTEFLVKNFDYFFTKKLNSNFSYLNLNTFNQDFLAYFKHLTYYFKAHRFLFFHDHRNTEFLKNYKIYEEVLKSNYGQNKDFDSYLFMSSNYNILNSNFNFFFINNLQSVFKQQFCWNNLQQKNLNLNNTEINIILNNFKSLVHYFKLNNYDFEKILLSKFFLKNNTSLYNINSAFLIFNKLEHHIKENIQNKFLLQNYYNSPRFFITTFDRLEFFLRYNYYHGRIFSKFDLENKEEIKNKIIFTYTENVLDKSLLLRTQNKFLSLEYYSIIDKIAKIENAVDLINLKKQKMPAALDIVSNDLNIHFDDLRPFVLKYPFPFVGEHLLLEREFTLKKKDIIIKVKRFKYFKQFLSNLFYVCSDTFSLKYFNIKLFKRDIIRIFDEKLITKNSEIKYWQDYILNHSSKINFDLFKDLQNLEINLDTLNIPKLLRLKNYKNFITPFKPQDIKKSIFYYVNTYFLDNYHPNYIKIKNTSDEKNSKNLLFSDTNLFEKWLYYVIFFFLEKTFLNIFFNEYGLLQNQQLICLDLNFENKMNLKLDKDNQNFFINYKTINNLFKDLNYSQDNHISKDYNLNRFVNFMKIDKYLIEVDPKIKISQKPLTGNTLLAEIEEDVDEDLYELIQKINIYEGYPFPEAYSDLDNESENEFEYDDIILTVEQQQAKDFDEEMIDLKIETLKYIKKLTTVMDTDALPLSQYRFIDNPRYKWLIKYPGPYTGKKDFWSAYIDVFMYNISRE